ncbi:MAG: hypothetical protein IPK26_16815 [Planctomycetes bacterium]|nr:hypothetical protein [Planctomycetota bacterium]
MTSKMPTCCGGRRVGQVEHAQTVLVVSDEGVGAFQEDVVDRAGLGRPPLPYLRRRGRHRDVVDLQPRVRRQFRASEQVPAPVGVRVDIDIVQIATGDREPRDRRDRRQRADVENVAVGDVAAGDIAEVAGGMAVVDVRQRVGSDLWRIDRIGIEVQDPDAFEGSIQVQQTTGGIDLHGVRPQRQRVDHRRSRRIGKADDVGRTAVRRRVGVLAIHLHFLDVQRRDRLHNERIGRIGRVNDRQTAAHGLHEVAVGGGAIAGVAGDPARRRDRHSVAQPGVQRDGLAERLAGEQTRGGDDSRELHGRSGLVAAWTIGPGSS